MKKDPILFGTVIGLLANVVKLTVNYLAFWFGFTEVVFWRLTATNFLAQEFLFDPLALVVGAVGDLVVAATLGVIFIYLLKFCGSKYLWFKAIGFALLAWVGLFGTLLGSQVEAKVPQTVSGVLVTIVAHSVFGLALAYFTKRIARV